MLRCAVPVLPLLFWQNFLIFFLNILPTILLTGKRKIIPLSLKINLDLLKNSSPAGLVCFRFDTPESYRHD